MSRKKVPHRVPLFLFKPLQTTILQKSDPASLLVFYAYATGGDSRSSTDFPSPCAKYKIAPFPLLRDGFSGLEVAFLCAKYKTLLEFVLRAFDMKDIPYFPSHPRHTQTPQSIYVATAFPPHAPFSCARQAWMLRLVYVAGGLCPTIYPITHKNQSAAITEVVPGSGS